MHSKRYKYTYSHEEIYSNFYAKSRNMSTQWESNSLIIICSTSSLTITPMDISLQIHPILMLFNIIVIRTGISVTEQSKTRSMDSNSRFCHSTAASYLVTLQRGGLNSEFFSVLTSCSCQGLKSQITVLFTHSSRSKEDVDSWISHGQ